MPELFSENWRWNLKQYWEPLMRLGIWYRFPRDDSGWLVLEFELSLAFCSWSRIVDVVRETSQSRWPCDPELTKKIFVCGLSLCHDFSLEIWAVVVAGGYVLARLVILSYSLFLKCFIRATTWPTDLTQCLKILRLVTNTWL